MFNNLLKKTKNSNTVISPVEGKIIAIENVDDEVFSSKMMGDGFAVEPSSNVVKIPISGKIVMIYPSLHAFGIETAEGINVLVHIGIDTVELNGEGFTSMIKMNQKVKAGTPAMTVDFDFIEKRGYKSTVMVIITDSGSFTKLSKNLNDTENILCLYR